MSFLPVNLNITNKKILIIGGGSVAAAKISILRQFTSSIFVVAKQVTDIIKHMDVDYLEKQYDPGDLSGVFLVYACTNNRALNATIKKDAERYNILVNVVDEPSLCDFISPAIFKDGDIVVAVCSNATNVKQSIAWRDKIKDMFCQ